LSDSATTRPSAPPRRRRLRELWPHFAHVYQKEIWRAAQLDERSFKGAWFAVLRIISITVTVFNESRIASRAAALSFSSLLGLGPLIAIAVLVAGFALGGRGDPNLVANSLDKIVRRAIPQIQEYEYLTQSSADLVSPKLVDVINNIIVASQSGSAGVLGVFSLILIVLLLFKSIEDAFNDIWGVRQGRSVLMRIVFYWTILTLGALLFFSSVALLSASTLVNLFIERLPGGTGLKQLLSWSLPAVSFAMLMGMLSVFYRAIPNTRVFWRAAFIGGLVVALLLVLNNYLQFLYVRRVVLQRSLYGSLALPLVVMSGLYIFWLCVLTGGIVSYAIQNVHFRNSQAAWSTLPESTRERISLVVFLTICRRFRECLPPISASQLSAMLCVPTQLLNECLNRLVQVQLVTTLNPAPGSAATDYLFQPARPLNRITLHDFKKLEEDFGENPIGASLERIDPLLAHYDQAVAKLGEHEFFRKNLEQLFADHPFDESRPPFTMGEKRVGK